MILQLRVDERRIHGQITTSWSKVLSPDYILVASDIAAANPIMSRALMMTQPAGMKVRIRSVDETIKAMQDPRAEAKKYFLITDTLKDALRLIDALDIKTVNVANMHSDKNAGPTVVVNTGMSLNQGEIALLREIAAKVENSFCQLLPTNEKKSLSSLLKNIK